MLSRTRLIREQRLGDDLGALVRLIDPYKTGNHQNPFVLMDYFHAKGGAGFNDGMHPHSGIATLTWHPYCDVTYRDLDNSGCLVKAGGIAWLNAASGQWHEAQLEHGGCATGFQWWFALPPCMEGSTLTVNG
jgi:redox-sensitive bicupin YhaK (pirin superfamily)